MHQLSRIVRDAPQQPSQDLPVTAYPAMFPPILRAVVGWIVIHHLDICQQTDAGIGALDQVVAQQRILREAAIQHFMKDLDLIQTFSGEDAFAVQVLIDVGDGASINVKTSLAGIDRSQS